MAEAFRHNMIKIPHTINPLGWTIVCVSDTHSKFSKISNFPPADIIIHAGDFSNVGEMRDIARFRTEYANIHYPVKLFIAGNHDLSLDKVALNNPQWSWQFQSSLIKLQAAKGTSITLDEYSDIAMEVVRNRECPSGHIRYLQDEYLFVASEATSSDVAGEGNPSVTSVFTAAEEAAAAAAEVPPVKIYGSPWQPEFFDWAFNLPRGPLLAEKWNAIPNDTDILITHGPPHKILDLTEGDKLHVGCEELRKLFDSGSIKPRLHVFGHIHETYGKLSFIVLFTLSCLTVCFCRS
jgi:3',5'-cyclic AMP phosphodiesterase CpdA